MPPLTWSRSSCSSWRSTAGQPLTAWSCGPLPRACPQANRLPHIWNAWCGRFHQRVRVSKVFSRITSGTDSCSADIRALRWKTTGEVLNLAAFTLTDARVRMRMFVCMLHHLVGTLKNYLKSSLQVLLQLGLCHALQIQRSKDYCSNGKLFFYHFYSAKIFKVKVHVASKQKAKIK